MNLPNKLTIARIISVPFFIAAYMFGYYILAFILFIAASFTDMLDGKIARKYNLVTNFGKIMDPLADKISGVLRLLSHGRGWNSTRLDAHRHSGEGICHRRHENCGCI